MQKLMLFVLALSLFFTTACNAQSSKSAATKSSGAAKLENRFSDGVVGSHDPALLQNLLSADFISHHFPAPGNNNKVAFTEGMRALFAGFPDIKVTRLEQHESGDKVYTYAYWEATQTGNFMGIPPTGKKVHVEYMDIWRAKDGKITENWVIMDIMGLMVQLGVVPPPGTGK